MLCGWEGNRRSGVAMAMRHRLQWFIHSPTGSRPKKGRRASRLYTPHWVWHFFLPRDAMLARTSHGPVSVCVRLSVSVSVTSRCSTKTAKCGIIGLQTTPVDSPGESSFLTPKISTKFHRGKSLRGR